MNGPLHLITQYAPPERASIEVICQQAGRFGDLDLVREMLDAVPNPVMILNENRQAVYANAALVEMLGEKSAGLLLGQRPGEMLHCIHAGENPAGCGTTEFCSTCGAINSILIAFRGRRGVQECLITQEVDGELRSLELLVSAVPFALQGERYAVYSLMDISNEKRRRALERIFFHDVLNTAGALQGVAYLLPDASEDEAPELEAMLSALSEQLVDEIQAQRQLADAENSDLVASPKTLDSVVILQGVMARYAGHPVSEGRSLRLDQAAQHVTFRSDPLLLGRVLGNMLKNALEASLPGQTVTASCDLTPAGVRFWVHNSIYMPRTVQLQLFQRSFSTKGAGRGLGTYSMRLLSERYLYGRITFTSTEEDGTTFAVVLPLDQEGSK